MSKAHTALSLEDLAVEKTATGDDQVKETRAAASLPGPAIAACRLCLTSLWDLHTLLSLCLSLNVTIVSFGKRGNRFRVVKSLSQSYPS